MRSSLILLAVLSTVAFVPAASAQHPAPSRAVAAPAATHAGQWRSSKLMGLDIYNDQNEKLGDVNEVLIDHSGKVTGFVIGVGGFLGMGERNILVDMGKLKFVNEPKSTATTGAGSTSQQRAPRNASEKWYPDHAVLSGATKDSVKAMPEFKYD